MSEDVVGILLQIENSDKHLVVLLHGNIAKQRKVKEKGNRGG